MVNDKIGKKTVFKTHSTKNFDFFWTKYKKILRHQDPPRGLTNVYFRNSAVYATIEKNNRPFQHKKSAAKERRQNILTKLVTKFSTSPPLTTPPPEFSPLPANKQKSQIVAT